ncbi:MAG: ankyrin repeat domain-containing protein [Phycisphaerales bacterium]|nr:ankyrin repeat domain-containing protein [Phycisphaerales bacterium]
MHSRLELIRPLIAAGAEVNGIVESTAMTPLHTAAMCGNEQAVKLLLELGADPALRTTRGQSAAELAAGPHRDDITSLLKKHTSN